MTHFINKIRTQTRRLPDASARGTLRENTDEELKMLIENMCQNDYRSSERAMKQKGLHEVDLNTSLLAQIEALSKYLVATQLDQANISQIQTLRCEFYGEGHSNGNCTLEVESSEIHHANFQKNNPYFNTYNPGWKDHLNFKWRNNQTLNTNQRVQHASQVL